jgi:hypothetical protein
MSQCSSHPRRKSLICFAHTNLISSSAVSFRRPVAPSSCSRGDLSSSVTRRQIACAHPSFDRAVADGIIIDKGCSVRVDQRGHIDRSSIPPRSIEESWREVVDFSVKSVLVHLPAEARRAVHAIYLRGSVASGFAIPGESDLDFLIYVGALYVDVLNSQRSQVSKHVTSKFKHVTRVDYRAHAVPDPEKSQADVFCGLPGAYVAQAFGVCVYGHDFVASCSPCRILCDLAIDIMNDKRIAVEEAERQKASGNAVGELRALQWFFKRALRASAELSCFEIGKFARDLVPCVRGLGATIVQQIPR